MIEKNMNSFALCYAVTLMGTRSFPIIYNSTNDIVYGKTSLLHAITQIGRSVSHYALVIGLLWFMIKRMGFFVHGNVTPL